MRRCAMSQQGYEVHIRSVPAGIDHNRTNGLGDEEQGKHGAGKNPERGQKKVSLMRTGLLIGWGSLSFPRPTAEGKDSSADNQNEEYSAQEVERDKGAVAAKRVHERIADLKLNEPKDGRGQHADP